MKIRSGFVSNSSSCSFLVKVPCNIDNTERLKHLETLRKEMEYSYNWKEKLEAEFDMVKEDKTTTIVYAYVAQDEEAVDFFENFIHSIGGEILEEDI